MQIYLYWSGGTVHHGDVADDIAEIIAERGKITGLGAGEQTANVDFVLYDQSDAAPLLAAIAKEMAENLPNAYLVFPGQAEEEDRQVPLHAYVK